MAHGFDISEPGADALPSADRLAKLRYLAWRVQQKQFDPNPGDGPVDAGYTYLAQLVAHDLTAPIDPIFPEGVGDGDISRTRPHPLSLETLYGDGPGSTPMLYELAASGAESIAGRTGRLRLGWTRRGPQGQEPEERDIPRLGCPVAPGDTGDRAVRGWPCPSDAPGHAQASEPIVADPRNDDHVLISQLLLVFIRLHNFFYDTAIRAHGGRESAKDVARAFRRARLATLSVYCSLLRDDLFPRLLEPKVWRHYLAGGGDDIPAGAGLNKVPAIFKHGAFRIGHSMVRADYVFGRVHSMVQIGAIQSRRSEVGAASLPIMANWVVDWTEFFGTSGEAAANRARGMHPSVTAPLAKARPSLDHMVDNDETLAGFLSLTLHDYVRSEMLAKPEIERIRTQAFGAEAQHGDLETLRELLPSDFFPEDAVFHDAADALAEIEGWLASDPQTRFTELFAGRPPSDTPPDWGEMARTAPLSFLVAFEAMGGDPARGRPGGGRLGPLGSALVARTVAPLLNDCIREHAEHAGEIGDLLSELGPDATTSMRALVDILESKQV